jgi:hypothetical protein
LYSNMMPVVGEYWPGSFSHGNRVRGVSEDFEVSPLVGGDGARYVMPLGCNSSTYILCSNAIV